MFAKSLAIFALVAMVEAHDTQLFIQNALDAAAAHELEQNCRPIIGVLSQPIRSASMQEYTDAGYTRYVEASYVEALNAVGARVVPLVPGADGDYSEINDLLPQLSGVLLTGGKGGNKDFTYHLLEKAQNYNDNGETFPVFGIDQSFQYMANWKDSEGSLFESNRAKKVSLPLSFVGNPEETKMFGDLGELAGMFEDNAFLWNYHGKTINPIKFQTDEGLASFWDLTSIMFNNDEANTPFVASMEAHDYPFFGVAFRPERPPTQPFGNWGLNRSEESLILNQYFFRNFVTYARQNSNSKRYDSWQDDIIQNYDSDVRNDYYGHVYLF